MLQANFLVADTNFEQSLLPSKICGEKRKEHHNKSERLLGRERATVFANQAPHGSRLCTRHLHDTLAVTEKKKNCSKSIEDIKINNVCTLGV